MATVYDIVGRALRLLRVANPNQPLKPADVATGIEALNAMMVRWEANTLSLGWSAVLSPDDTLPAPDEAHEAIVYNLAVKLRPEYGTSLDADVIAAARQGYADLLRDQILATPLKPDRSGGHYNIYTDDYQ
jgi:hypothetical protein